MSNIPIGLQLYSVRTDYLKDPVGTLKSVAGMGYAGVEFFGGNFGGMSAKDLKTMLDELGLQCCGAHTPLDSLLGDALPRTAEYAQAIGNKYLVVPGLSEDRRNSLAAWRATAGMFNEIAPKLKPYGVRLGYHNHDIEFRPMEGVLPFDVFFGAANPEIIMQVDLGHVVHAGADPLTPLKKYPGRATSVHVTEYSADGQALVGDRWPHWSEVFAICETTGKTEWYVVEQEIYPYPPLESVKRCLDNVKKMGR